MLKILKCSGTKYQVTVKTVTPQHILHRHMYMIYIGCMLNTFKCSGTNYKNKKNVKTVKPQLILHRDIYITNICIMLQI